MRSIAFELAFTSQMNGRAPTRNHCSGPAMARAVASAWVIEKIFGTCSPAVMWAKVVTK
jgi:hypothetical protein